MRYLCLPAGLSPVVGLVLTSLSAGCINANSTDCSRGYFLGGAAGTDKCAPQSYLYADPRFQAGVPFETVRPDGRTQLVPGSESRAAENLRPVLRALERERRAIRREQLR